MKNLIKKIKSPSAYITTNVPHRVEPGKSIPVVSVIKNPEGPDLDLLALKIVVRQGNEVIHSKNHLEKRFSITAKNWYALYHVRIPNTVNGMLEIEVELKIEVGGKRKIVRNSSLRDRDHALRVYKSDESLPKFDGFCFGDLFNHSYYMNSTVGDSFPLNVKAAVEFAKGNVFASSYCNDGSKAGLQTQSENVDSKKVWEQFLGKVEKINATNKFVLFPGQYIHCKNQKGKNINLLVLNHKEKLQRGPEQERNGLLSGGVNSHIKDIIQTFGDAVITITGDSAEKKSLFSNMFSQNGKWQLPELSLPNLSGVHVGINNGYESSTDGKLKWLLQLLNGQRKFIATGSTFFSLRNRKRKTVNGAKNGNNEQSLNYGRLGVICSTPNIPDNIIKSIKSGKVVVTNGPLVDFALTNENSEKAGIGEEIKGKKLSINYKMISTKEFGALSKLCLYLGNLATHTEELIYNIHFQKDNYDLHGALEIETPNKPGYLRCELFSGQGNDLKYCFTNPIWVSNG